MFGGKNKFPMVKNYSYTLFVNYLHIMPSQRTTFHLSFSYPWDSGNDPVVAVTFCTEDTLYLTMRSLYT